MPSSVSTSTTVQLWKRNVFIVSCGEGTRSIALEQKLPCGGTVGPFHSKTRARTDLIFMGGGSVGVGIDAGRRPALPERATHAARDAERVGRGVDVRATLARDVVRGAVGRRGDGHRQAPLHGDALREAEQLDR